METITIEKWLKFNNVIDNLNELNVLKDVEYEIDKENHALIKIGVVGNLKTSLSSEKINETINVDIYTPLNKKISKDLFSVEVKDYSYTIESTNLGIYVVLNINGFIDNITSESDLKENNDDELLANNENNTEALTKENELTNENIDDISNDELQQINALNEINTLREERKKENKDELSSSWADNLFKLNDSYTSFFKK